MFEAEIANKPEVYKKGQKLTMYVPLYQLREIGRYIVQNGAEMKPGEFFKIKGLDGNEVVMWLK